MVGDMRDIVMDKVVVNIGTGSETTAYENAKRLLATLTNAKPASAMAKRRIPTFKIGKGTKIGVFVTLRGKRASELANRLFKTVDNKVGKRAISGNSVNFGIKEYIDIPGLKYDPTIGIIGMNVNVSFKRKGIRVARRKRGAADVGKKHMLISREEIKEHLKKDFGVEVSTGAE